MNEVTLGFIFLIGIPLFFILCIFMIVKGIKSILTTSIVVSMIDSNGEPIPDFCEIKLKKDCLIVEKGIIKKEIVLNEPIKKLHLELNREYTPEEKAIIEKDKSVIGRAVVGGLLLGPVGAIVGGMSGIGTKKENVIVQKEDEKIYIKIFSPSHQSSKTNLFFLVNKHNNKEAYNFYNQFTAQKMKFKQN